MSYDRKLDNPLSAYRIGDPMGEFPIWDDGGARLSSGRWHEAGAAVSYASEHYSTAMLEKLVHYQGEIPSGQHFIEITIPAGTIYEVVNSDLIDGWSAPDGEAARRFGRQWYSEKRSAILIVPSVVARMESNIVFNTQHADFKSIKAGLETPIWWDERLFDR
ncbi:RES domain-containing protein [Roseobacter sp. HKCCD9010]|uniref:RES family NAD+ phosphorylase n=1 Tax=unclassified Roseobacter TaxID=196798 RepID=UPI00149127D0|nr:MULTISPECIES: RES domain-containing protein [unclassified Roseobacter]MBF9052614.1 RES domain-containing protein [Rhodobacterales bacterium HKCCD4356]NNV14549.1 RES domain-containing protein [Roseobacter sp. HKCCD7357]NNV18713.1 RES domain-containing protein [Roseobacter sp. HKCCD8768]NNV28265.1 RES domain-containing protein [Roseobacter sp. HKCCD8192]NNV32538.1 RES domain-containing protein [Roseobacter sp. HKCCD9061]